MNNFYLTGLLILSAAASYQPAYASVIKVRAGEHGEYSRIVLPLNRTEINRAKVTIDKSTNTVQIRNLPSSYTLDIAELNISKKAHRVRSADIVSSDKETALLLSLTCACDIVRHTDLSNALIIDVRGGAEISETATAKAPTKARSTESETAISGGTQAADSEESDQQESIRVARERLMSLLAKANAQGTIKLKQPLVAISQDKPDAGATNGLSRASFSEEFAKPVSSLPVASLDECPDRHALNAISISGPEYSYNDIIRLRRNLQSAESATRTHSKLEIALAYAALGLFEEAQATINGTDHSTNFKFLEALLEFAAPSIKGDVNRPQPGAFSKIAECDPISMGLHAAASSLVNDRVAFDHAKLSGLLSLKPTYSGPIHARLANAAIDRDDEAAATAFTTIAEIAFGEPQPRTTRILRARLQSWFSNPAASVEAHKTSDIPSSLPQAASGDPLPEVATEKSPIERRPFVRVQALTQRSVDGRADYEVAQTDKVSSSAGAHINQSLSGFDEGASTFVEKTASVSATRKRSLAEALEGPAEDRRIAAAMTIANESTVFADDAPLINAAAMIAAEYGLLDVISDLYGGDSNVVSRAEVKKIARAALNANAPASAVDVTRPYSTDPELALLSLRALNRIATPESKQEADMLLEKISATGVVTPELAQEAFKVRNWNRATRLYEFLPSSALSTEDAEKFVFSSLASGSGSPSEQSLQALAKDNTTRAVMESFFTRAPKNSTTETAALSKFHDRIKEEILYIKEHTAQ